MPNELTPAQLAAVDRARAELRDLVQLIGDHQADCPYDEGTCPGGPAIALLVEIGCEERARVLVLALSDLAKRRGATA